MKKVKWKWTSFSRVWLFAMPWTVESMEFSRPEYWEKDSLSLLQGIYPTWGSNPGLPHCRRILYRLSHKESPRILEWVIYPGDLPDPGFEFMCLLYWRTDSLSLSHQGNLLSFHSDLVFLLCLEFYVASILCHLLINNIFQRLKHIRTI